MVSPPMSLSDKCADGRMNCALTSKMLGYYGPHSNVTLWRQHVSNSDFTTTQTKNGAWIVSSKLSRPGGGACKQMLRVLNLDGTQPIDGKRSDS